MINPVLTGEKRQKLQALKNIIPQQKGYFPTLTRELTPEELEKYPSLKKAKPKIPLELKGDEKTEQLTLQPATGWTTKEGYTFDECWQLLEIYFDLPLTIGIVVRELVFIDLDDVLDEFGNIVGNEKLTREQVRWIIDQCNSYTEISSSGRGLHILVKATFDGSTPKPFEIAGRGKFCMLTGDIFEGRDKVIENQTAIDLILTRFFPSKVKEEPANKKEPVPHIDPKELGPKIVEIVRPYYLKGQRHDLSLALAGMLIKRFRSPDLAKEVITQLAENDEEKKDRLKTIETTWKLFQRGEEIAGWSWLKELLPSEVLRELNEVMGEELPFQVLGISPNHEILVWDGEMIKTFTVRSIRQDLRLYVPKDKVGETAEKIIEIAREKGNFDPSLVLRSPLIDRTELGFLILSGKNAYLYDGQKLVHLKTPTFGKRILELKGPDFFEPKVFDAVAKDDISLKEVFFKLREHFAQFCFASESLLDFFVAYVMLAPFEKILPHRAIIWITGPKGVGKTTLFESVLRLFNDSIAYEKLAIKRDKVTPASFLQEVGNRGIIFIHDEFEPPTKEREKERYQDLCQLFKSCYSGGTITKGTTKRNPESYELFHMVFLGSIYVAPIDDAFQSRMIIIELKKPEKKEFNTIKNTQILRHGLLYAMMKSFPEIERRAEQIRNQRLNEVDDVRKLDLVSYPLAILEIVYDTTIEIPTELFATEERDDEERFLAELMSKYVREKQKTVAMILEEILENENFRDQPLEHFGLKWVRTNDRIVLAINPTLLRNLYDARNVKTHLARLSNGEQKTEKIAGTNQRCWIIPLERLNALGYFVPEDEDEDEEEIPF